MNGSIAFDVVGLTKSFGNHKIFTDITFRVSKNEVFGIIGANGAGKTTLVRHLVGFSRIDAGRIEFLGRPVSAPGHWLRTYIGYMPQGAATLNHLTCEQALYHAGRIRGLSQGDARQSTDRLLDLWEISSLRSRDSFTLSSGEARLLRLAVTMIGEPAVLVLDEPTAHMDLRHRRRVHTILDHLAATTTVVIVTHDVREASAILDKVALLSAGRLQILSSRHRSQRPDCCLIPKLSEDNPRMQEPVLDIGFERAADNEWLGLCVSEVHNEPE